MLTKVTEELWPSKRDVNEVADLRDLLFESSDSGVGIRVGVAFDPFTQ